MDGGGKVTGVNHAPPLAPAAATRITPVPSLTAEALLGLHVLRPERYPVLLQSAATSGTHNYDILLAFPGERLILGSDGRVRGPASVQCNDFLAALDDWWRTTRLTSFEPAVSKLPFTGGWFLFLGYELAAQIESRLRLPMDSGCIAQAIRIPAAIVRRTQTGQSWLVAEADAADLIEALKADLREARPYESERPQRSLTGEIVEDPEGIYLRAVNSALEHIAAGDIYQANLSRGWQARLRADVSVPELYRSLCDANPAPFGGLAVLDDFAIVSSSPERLIEVRDGWVTTRPIAGTRPRAANQILDRALLRELRSHPKEQAEHVMLLDLERNDLGRICEAGSVSVEEYMTLESYAHVHHIVSAVRGRLRPDITPGQAIAAVFPGGTITGCPKVRCMEIIADLERTPRGAYTGSMGYLNRDGSMDLNILIRSLCVRGDQVRFRAGAGIVADSDPRRELAETRAKALGMLRALQSGGAPT